MVAAGFAHRGNTPCTDRSWNHAHRAQRVQRAALEILAGDVLERLPACPQVDSVADFRISRNRADFRIQEMRHQPRYRVAGDHRVGIDSDENLLVRRCFKPKFRASALPEFGLVRISTRPGASSSAKAGVRNFQRLVA